MWLIDHTPHLVNFNVSGIWGVQTLVRISFVLLFCQIKLVVDNLSDVTVLLHDVTVLLHDVTVLLHFSAFDPLYDWISFYKE